VLNQRGWPKVERGCSLCQLRLQIKLVIDILLKNVLMFEVNVLVFEVDVSIFVLGI